MAVKTLQEMLTAFNERIGDDSSDKSLAFIEDLTDTMNDLSKKVTDSGNWEQKYKDNDAEWRKKYRDRFTSGSTEEDDISDPDTDDSKSRKQYTYESLFKGKD